jgi:hypothetical protein
LGQGGGAVEGLVQVAVDWLGVEADVEAAVGCPDWAFEKAAVEENGGERADFVDHAHAWSQAVHRYRLKSKLRWRQPWLNRHRYTRLKFKVKYKLPCGLRKPNRLT